jgi:hypothetical protein
MRSKSNKIYQIFQDVYWLLKQLGNLNVLGNLLSL